MGETRFRSRISRDLAINAPFRYETIVSDLSRDVRCFNVGSSAIDLGGFHTIVRFESVEDMG